MVSSTSAQISEENIDDLLYFARVGDKDEFDFLRTSICIREKVKLAELLEYTKEKHSGNGPMHMAAANGHDALLADICKAITDSAPQNPAMLAVLNAQNNAGNTALHWAALNGHLPAVKVLLENGADPTITNHRGHDAIFEAELNDKSDVVKWVLEEGGAGLEAGFGEKKTHFDGDAGEESDEGPEGGEIRGNILADVVEKMKEIDVQDKNAQS